MRTSATRVSVALLPLMLAVLVATEAARAQIQSTSTVSTGDSECFNTNNANKFCGFSVDLLESSSDTFSSVYRWNINADSPLLSDSTAEGNAEHHIDLDIFGASGAWYELSVDQEWNFAFSVAADGVGSYGVELSGTACEYADTSLDLVSGELILNDWDDSLDNDHSYSETATAVLRFQGNGTTQTYPFEFSWHGKARSEGAEVAFRMGEQNGSTTNCNSCNYPGAPSRTQEGDGHFVTFTLEKLCGNGVIDSDVGEECDGGACCDETTCMLQDDSVCDDGESCTRDFCSLQGVEAICGQAVVANGTSCSDGLHCNGTDTCQAGECADHSGDPCAASLGDGDDDCSESCDEDTDSCTASDANGSACDDGLFCTESDSCFNGGCLGLGSPCPDVAGDTDADCSESCNDSTDDCTANDVEGVPCSDDLYCNGTDTCDGSGSCATHTGDPCPGADGDADCSESCSESAGACTANDPSGSACTDGLYCTGTDTCDDSGACASHTGDPCPGADGDTDCAESCNETEESCTGVDPDGTLCRSGSHDVCDPSEVCAAGACPADAKAAAGTACGDDDVCDGEETCDGSGICQFGVALDCDDGDLCTQDSCDAMGGCSNDAHPAATCLAVDQASLRIEERFTGNEKLVAKFLSGPVLEQTDFGNPLAYGGTSHAFCLYDALGDLAGKLALDRAGLTCSGARRACWRPIGGDPPNGLGYRYNDSDALSDGLMNVQLRGNGRSPSHALVRAANDSRRGLLSLPTGVAAALEGHSRTTMQLMSSDGVCLSAELTRSGRDLPGAFRARVE